MEPTTPPSGESSTPRYTTRHLLLTLAYAALALLARRLLAPVSHTGSWVTFGAILIGGIHAVSADAGSASHAAWWRTGPRILIMLCIGGLIGFFMSRV